MHTAVVLCRRKEVRAMIPAYALDPCAENRIDRQGESDMGGAAAGYACGASTDSRFSPGMTERKAKAQGQLNSLTRQLANLPTRQFAAHTTKPTRSTPSAKAISPKASTPARNESAPDAAPSRDSPETQQSAAALIPRLPAVVSPALKSPRPRRSQRHPKPRPSPGAPANNPARSP